MNQGVQIDTFDCPVCGLKVEVMRTAQGDAMLHKMPPCESFIKLSDKDYAALVTPKHLRETEQELRAIGVLKDYKPS